MRKGLSVIFVFLFFINSSVSALTFDTNIIMSSPKNITNVAYSIVPETEIPNSYLITGKIEPDPIESPIRRFDIMFFISIPITFYLTLNIMQIKNRTLYSFEGLTGTDWNYIYFNTLIIPLSVAFDDLVIMNSQNSSELNFQLPILQLKF